MMLSIILRYFEDLEAVPDADREGEDDHDIGKHDDYLAKKHLNSKGEKEIFVQRKFKRKFKPLPACYHPPH